MKHNNTASSNKLKSIFWTFQVFRKNNIGFFSSLIFFWGGGASINYGQLLVEYLYQDWRYPIWPLNMILILWPLNMILILRR